MSFIKIKNSEGVFEDVDTINGLSAYQVAVKNGYTGTEAEWIASLSADSKAAAQTANTAASNANAAANGTGYLVCSTDAATAAKTVDLSSFVLSTKSRLLIKMANYNSAASPTLNVNSTGTKAIYLGGSVASASNTWCAGDVLDMYYDGTNWQANVVSAKELLFRDMWYNGTNFIGKYNYSTGFYEFNDVITNLTYNDASFALLNTICVNPESNNLNASRSRVVYIAGNSFKEINASFMCNGMTLLEYATISSGISCNSMVFTFRNCKKLKRIDGIIYIRNLIAANTVYTFDNCENLISLSLNSINCNFTFSSSPLLSYDSIKYLVDNKLNSTTAITVTVHATTYSYLTGTATDYTSTGHTQAEWQAIVTSATSKALTFASA